MPLESLGGAAFRLLVDVFVWIPEVLLCGTGRLLVAIFTAGYYPKAGHWSEGEGFTGLIGLLFWAGLTALVYWRFG